MSDQITATPPPTTTDVPTQTTPVESPPPVAPPPVPDKALAQRVRDMLARDQVLRQKEQALVAREATVQRATRLEALAKSDPGAYLREIGVSYEDFAKGVLKNDDGGVSRVQSTVEELQQRIAALQAAEESRKEEATRAAYVRDIEAQVRASDKFPLLNGVGAYQTVLDTMMSVLHSTGETVSETQAAEMVEKQLQGLADALTQARGASVGTGATQRTPGTPATTLTNQHGTDAQPRSTLDDLSEDEAINRLVTMLQFDD